MKNAILLLLLIIACISCGKSRTDRLADQFAYSRELADNGDKDRALSILLDLERELQDKDSEIMKFKILSKIGALYYDDYKREQAVPYLKRALRVARRCGDDYLCPALWNLALVTNDTSLVTILKECATTAELSGNIDFETRALTSLSNLYSIHGNQDEAQTIIENLNSLQGKGYRQQTEIIFAKIYHLFYQNKYDNALLLLDEVNSDSLTLDGKTQKYWFLYNIEKQKGNYVKALQFRDSLDNIRADIDSIARSENFVKVKQEFHNRINHERSLRNIAILIGAFAAIILTGIILWGLNRRKLMKKQLELTEQISRLNLRLSRLATENPEDNSDKDRDDINTDIIEKLRLNRELYYTLPEYSILKQLNLIRDIDKIDKSKTQDVLSSVIGRFADVCNNIHQFYPAMTYDDTLYCAAIFVGFSKEVAAVAFSSSEDALRRRKSRIKQKLPASIFKAVFGTKV